MQICLAMALALAITPCLTVPSIAEPPQVTSVELLIGEADVSRADESPLRFPFGIDFDTAGNMFIIELGGGRVHQRTVAGTLSQIGGDGSESYRGDGGPLSQATFHGMHNVAVTTAGKMYIADSWNHCIREVDLKTMTISTSAGTGVAGFAGDGGPASAAQFDYLMCLTLNPREDKLHIADLKNLRIREIDLTTNIITTIAGNGEKGRPINGAKAVASPLIDPRAVAADSQGRVYILERNGNALRRINADGTLHTVAGNGKKDFTDGAAWESSFAGPKHICVDADDRVYIADDLNAAIRCYDPTTETVSTLLGRSFGDPELELLHPHGVCIENGKLYVIDTGHHRLFKVSLTFP